MPSQCPSLPGSNPALVVGSTLGFLELGVLGAGGAVALAMVPDWDMRIPFVSYRGPTHTV